MTLSKKLITLSPVKMYKNRDELNTYGSNNESNLDGDKSKESNTEDDLKLPNSNTNDRIINGTT